MIAFKTVIQLIGLCSSLQLALATPCRQFTFLFWSESIGFTVCMSLVYAFLFALSLPSHTRIHPRRHCHWRKRTAGLFRFNLPSPTRKWLRDVSTQSTWSRKNYIFLPLVKKCYLVLIDDLLWNKSFRAFETLIFSNKFDMIAEDKHTVKGNWNTQPHPVTKADLVSSDKHVIKASGYCKVNSSSTHKVFSFWLSIMPMSVMVVFIE